MLLVSALRDAAERRFGRTWSGADLVSYVARVRARDPSRAGAIDPLTAERVLRGALGDGEAVAGLSSDQFARTFVELLIELIIDEQQAGTGLDEFLDRAIRRSERYPY
ncbi:hypothetical protein CLV72_101737 [Allonocardiopsis opalescens]|uniref:Uncharacterized protein n=1 Tax=Allonocardiopsis opalescens TaxID=1144618 RepID=A0A2T0QDX2_9ACTN|nr:hypothetical protein CLV72_101737 [Allonocardiopsis opalescens]